MKMHTLLDLRGNIPSFIHVSDGKLHDVHALDLLLPEPGAIYVMDRGYVDFARLHGLHQAGAFFVTRAKSNMDAHRVYSAPTDRATGIICDQTIALDGHYTSRHYPDCSLVYRVKSSTPFVFNFEAARFDAQTVQEERLQMIPKTSIERWTMPESGNGTVAKTAGTTGCGVTRDSLEPHPLWFLEFLQQRRPVRGGAHHPWKKTARSVLRERRRPA